MKTQRFKAKINYKNKLSVDYQAKFKIKEFCSKKDKISLNKI
jgi:hypothetical protein